MDHICLRFVFLNTFRLGSCLMEHVEKWNCMLGKLTFIGGGVCAPAAKVVFVTYTSFIVFMFTARQDESL